MQQFSGLWFGILALQVLCVVGAFALREKSPNLSVACWVVFGLLLLFKYVLIFRRAKQQRREAEDRSTRN